MVWESAGWTNKDRGPYQGFCGEIISRILANGRFHKLADPNTDPKTMNLSFGNPKIVHLSLGNH